MTPLHQSHLTDTKTEIRKVVASSINERLNSPSIDSKPPLTAEEVRAMSDHELNYALDCDWVGHLRTGSLGMLTDERIRRMKLVEGQNRDSFLAPITILLSMASILMAAAMWVKVFIPWLKNIF